MHKRAPTKETSRRIGLARALSKLGYCSRSQAFEIIRGGRVALNGRIRRDPETPVDMEGDQITVDGVPVPTAPRVYLMLNKPRGLVTTTADEKDRDTIYSCLTEDLPWVAPVGRLDKASEGLLLLTNDSEWAARILAPETHLDKIYHVQIDTIAEEQLLNVLRQGGTNEDGDVLRAKGVDVLRTGERNSWLEIVLDEGKNRHIRRMLAAVNVNVLRLVRVAVGPLLLGSLAKGSFRHLSPDEVAAVDRAMSTGTKRSFHF